MKADHTQVSRLLKTARGQIDGILKMVEEDRYCLDVSNQPGTIVQCTTCWNGHSLVCNGGKDVTLDTLKSRNLACYTHLLTSLQCGQQCLNITDSVRHVSVFQGPHPRRFRSVQFLVRLDVLLGIVHRVELELCG